MRSVNVILVVVAMVICAGGQMTEPPCKICTPQRCASAEKYVDCSDAFPPMELPCNGYLTGSVCVETAPSCIPCVQRVPPPACCSADCNCYYECDGGLAPDIKYCEPGFVFVNDKCVNAKNGDFSAPFDSSTVPTAGGPTTTESQCPPLCTPRCFDHKTYVDCEAAPPMPLPCDGYLTGSVCVESAPSPSCVPCVPLQVCQETGIFGCPGDCTCYYECDPTMVPQVTYCEPGLEFSELHQRCMDIEEAGCSANPTSSSI